MDYIYLTILVVNSHPTVTTQEI